MRQIIQSLKTGTTTVAEIPAPEVGAGQVLIRATRSLVSAGTERMLVGFGQANLLQKARQQPDKVRAVLDKVRTDGLQTTVEAVRSKLDQPLALGYCHVGQVEAIGPGVRAFAVGQRVISNSPHAELVAAPTNLCAAIPDSVGDDAAAFTVVAAIGLQGMRLARPTLGECVVVTGLGLIGQLTAQLLRANGCRVLGIDPSTERVALARSFGIETVDLSCDEDPLAAADRLSRGRGVDAVLVTATTTSSEPIAQAARMCRKRGRIVLVGVTGLELSRDLFYEKELSFQVSCSYGPGRYEPKYEQAGMDYPIGYVRWTEQRNFEAALDMMASGALAVAPMISHRFAFAQAEQAYATLTGGDASLGILLDYPPAPDSTAKSSRKVRLREADHAPVTRPALGFIGAGNYAGRVLIPAFAQSGALLQSVATSSGVNAVHFGRKFGFREAASGAPALIADPGIDAVVIATRHNSHAALAAQALASGKHVFVEKPLAITHEQLETVQTALLDAERRGSGVPSLMVGFNRRFAPHVQRMQALLEGVKGPKAVSITMNAGALPASHWTQDPDVGGGRILGEACHLVDLARFLAGSPISRFDAHALREPDAAEPALDTAHIDLGFEDGSIATIQYLANGHSGFPKERVEVFAAGRILQLDNFRVLRGFGWPRFRSMRLLRQDKGQQACARAFVDAIEGGAPAPIPLTEILEISEVCLAIADRVRSG